MTKKNIRGVPPTVKAQLQRLKDRYVVAACLQIYSADKLLAGVLKHLGICISKNGFEIANGLVIPPTASGKFSHRNVHGYEVVRKDLPKETHYNSIESPNWGDSYNGTHTVDLPYEKYPRDFYGPQHARIKIASQSREAGKMEYLLTFEVDRVLDRQSPSFENDLLECLNLLQENVGACGVQKAGVTLAEYLQAVKVSWEVLPPGTRNEAMARLFANRKPSPQEKETAEERYDFFMKLNPRKLVYGTSGLQRYFGALLEDDLVVFENIEYGNAIYIMFGDWEKLSKRSRTELLSGRYGNDFERVPHTSGWKGRVRTVVGGRRNTLIANVTGKKVAQVVNVPKIKSKSLNKSREI